MDRYRPIFPRLTPLLDAIHRGAKQAESRVSRTAARAKGTQVTMALDGTTYEPNVAEARMLDDDELARALRALRAR